jgi:hypothetical protein
MNYHNEDAGAVIRAALAKAVQVLTPIAAAIMAVVVAALCWVSVNHLFSNYLRSADLSWLAASATVGMALLLAGYTATHAQHDPAARGIAVLFAVIWVALAFVLAMLDAALRSALFAVPDGIAAAGQFLAGGLSGLGLAPVVLIPLVARSVPAGKYHSVFGAIADYLATAVKGLAFIASIVAEASYGITIGVAPLVAVPAALAMGVLFISALGKLSHARNAADHRDITAWKLVAVVVGGYLMFVSFESMLSFADASGKLAWLHSGMVDRVAQALYIAALGIIIALTLLINVRTTADDRAARGEAAPAESVPTLRPAQRLANTLTTAREDWRAVTGVWRMVPEPKQLPAAQQFADDASAPIAGVVGNPK